MNWQRILGVPPDLLRLELKRELFEVRKRYWVIRSALYGAPVAFRIKIDNGTIVLDEHYHHASFIDCMVIRSPGAAIQFDSEWIMR